MNNETLPAMLGLMLLFPALGACLSYLIGKKKPELAGWIATGAAALSFVAALGFFFDLAHGQTFEQRLFTWFAVGDLKIPFTLRFDELTALMTLVVCGVGSLIHLYSIGYMHADPDQPRFFAYLNLFMFAMLTLVLGGNLVVLFVGWEGVGLCSYLLIGFWYKNPEYAAAGRKAFVVTRIGDAGFLIGIFLLFANFGTLDFVELAALVKVHPDLVKLYTAIALFLFFGACGKSAQIPLFVWLPDAMAGPTPVSALIHAATMVTAGIYMMSRLHFIYDLAPIAMLVVAVIAVLTAFVAATIALVQTDLKKILAYSTISQLGFMFLGCASGIYWVALFHLVTHAFFKACLFLCAGSVMHGCGDEKYVDRLGGLWNKMPWTAGCYALAGLAIAGIAPFAGFYSKTAILHSIESNTNPAIAPWLHAIVALAIITAVLTAFYMTRSFVLTFLGEYRGTAHPHESSWPMRHVLVALAVLCVLGGFGLEGSISHYLAPVVGEVHHEGRSFLSLIVQSWEGALGVSLGYLVYARYTTMPDWLARHAKTLSSLIHGKYFLDEIYDFLIVRPLKGFADFSAAVIDRYLVDGAAHGLAALTMASGSALRQTQSGQIRQYAGFMFGALAVVVAIYIFH